MSSRYIALKLLSLQNFSLKSPAEYLSMLLDNLKGKKLKIIFYYPKRNRNSLRALINYLELRGALRGMEIAIPRNSLQLLKLVKGLRNDEAGIILISLMTPQRGEVRELVRSLRKTPQGGELILIGGGPHPTGAPEDALEIGFDLVALGEGELTLEALLKVFFSRESLAEIPGLAWLERGELRYSGFPPDMVRDLDEVPAYSHTFRLYGPIEITRGCPWRCPFCQTSFAFGHVRHRSLEDITKTIDNYLRVGLRDIRFITPNALSYGSPDGKATNEEALKELFQIFRHYRSQGARIFFGSFPSELRLENVSETILSLMRSSVDNERVVVGLQSGSERLLKRLNRLNLREAIERIELIIRSGFGVDVDFIFGFPFETDEDLRDSLRTYEVLSRLGARVHAHYFMPLPGTPYSRLTPRPLPSWFLKELDRLASEGKLFGSWRNQIEISKEITTSRKQLG